MSNFINDANWRYATKKFDASKKVSTNDLNTLKYWNDIISLSKNNRRGKIKIINNYSIQVSIIYRINKKLNYTYNFHLLCEMGISDDLIFKLNTEKINNEEIKFLNSLITRKKAFFPFFTFFHFFNCLKWKN